MDDAIRTFHISKVYNPPGGWRSGFKRKAIVAVDGVSIAVRKGEIYGLLGPNGAGKTTLVKMLCALILPSSGSASLAGISLQDERKIRSITGLVVSDERSFYWRLSVKRNLEFFAAMYGLHGPAAASRIERLLDELGLAGMAQQRFSDLSSGMRQRLALARAMLHQPQLLFLDEPTRSLDPIATRNLHDLIMRVMQEREMTVFLITHDLAEAEKLCHRIALMQDGQIRQAGLPDELRRQLRAEQKYRMLLTTASPAVLLTLQNHFADVTCSPGANPGDQAAVEFSAHADDGKLTAIIDHLRQRNVEIASIEASPLSLEHVFAQLLGAEEAGAE